jgi:type VI secretion system protein ImpA
VSSFTLENYLTEIAPDSPCGASLEDDFAFAQLENEAKFVGERQMGGEIIPEVEPDWKKVRASALDLLARSRDIQIAMHLACALLHTDGISGLNEGLALIHGLLANYWEEVHPRQDPEDDYPILRVNTLGTLKDGKKILGPLGKLSLTQSKAGNFCWREIELARDVEANVIPKSDLIPDMALIEAAFLDTPLDFLKTQASHFKKTQKLLQDIVALVADKAGSVNTPDVAPLLSVLININKFLAEKIQQRAEAAQEDGAEAEAEAVPGVEGETTPSRVPARTGSIQSREDVIRSIDAICKYFERYEPSSPVPLLLLRAKKMLTMNFMEILSELAPDAVKQAETICGVTNRNNP